MDNTVLISFSCALDELRSLIATANAAAGNTAELRDDEPAHRQIAWQEDLEKLLCLLTFRREARSLALRLSGWVESLSMPDDEEKLAVFAFALPIGRLHSHLTHAIHTWLLHRLLVHKLTPDFPRYADFLALTEENMHTIIDILYTLEYAEQQ